MPPASVNAISRASQAAAASQIDANPNSFSLRDFFVDEDAANFTSALWQSIDQTSFIVAQTEALEAFNVAKAIRLSEKSAALEQQRRTVATTSSSASTSTSASSSASFSSAAESRPGPSSSASDFARQKSSSASSSLHERKPSSSASAAAAAQQSSPPGLSLSTQSSSFVDKTTSDFSSSRAANSVPSSSALQSHASQSHRIEHRSLSKRELDSPIINFSTSMSHHHHHHSSSASASASASATSSASTSASSSSSSRIDVTNTKRRRTERQLSTSPNSPSTTQQHYHYQQQQLVAPAITVPKKSTGTPRDVRPVQTANPRENHASTSSTPVEPRSRHRSTAYPRPPMAPEPRDTFTVTRSCTKCGTPVLSPRGQPSTDVLEIIPLLHVTCNKCQTSHCRGCFTPARCNRALVLASSHSSSSRSPPTNAAPHGCDGGSTCTVRTCCPAVRAIAIFEALSWFDEIYAAEAGFGSTSKGVSDKDKDKGRGTKEQRDAYVRMLISKTDVVSASKAETRRFEDAFVRTLKLICAWLQVPDREDGADEDAHTGDKDAMHASVPRLFMSSMLLEVVHVFLTNTNVRDWVAHAETYLAILDLLRRMLDISSSSPSSPPSSTGSSPTASSGTTWADSITLTTILRAPMRRIESSSGLRRAVWGDASVRYEDLSAPSAVGTEGTPIRYSLCDLVKHLEAHRRPLMALAARITFAATVEKVNNLCDGISYLLLQQVVGGI